MQPGLDPKYYSCFNLLKKLILPEKEKYIFQPFFLAIYLFPLCALVARFRKQFIAFSLTNHSFRLGTVFNSSLCLGIVINKSLCLGTCDSSSVSFFLRKDKKSQTVNSLLPGPKNFRKRISTEMRPLLTTSLILTGSEAKGTQSFSLRQWNNSLEPIIR